VEKQLKTQGISLEEADLATMDQLWDEAKRLERLPTQSTLDREQ